MKYSVIERVSNRVIASWDEKNIKSVPELDSLDEMRNNEFHKDISFLITFKGLDYSMAMYSVDQYDLIQQ